MGGVESQRDGESDAASKLGRQAFKEMVLSAPR